MILADPLRGRALARGVRRVALGLAGAWWVSSLNAALTGPSFEPSLFDIAALVALGLPLVWGLVSLKALDGPVTQLQVFVLVGLAIRLVQPIVAAQPTGTADYSPLNPVLTATAALVCAVLMPRLGIPIIVIHGAVIAGQRVAVVGVAQAVTEGVDFVAADLVMMVVIWAVREGLDRRAVTTAAALDAETRAASASHRAMVREKLDGLVHDKVLAALMLASRGERGEAAVLARAALGELGAGDEPPPVPYDSVSVIVEHAALLGLDLAVEGDAWAPGRVGDALRAATCEALTNIARHAGTSSARVRTSRQGARYVVEVSDHGAGFDVTAIPHDRLGVTERIMGSMAAVGAEVEIHSKVGHGTRIRMAATVADAEPARSPSWAPGIMVWAIPPAALSLLAHMVIGGLHLSQVVSRSVVVGGFVVLPVLGVLAVVIPRRGPRWYALLTVSVLTWAVLLTNVRDPYVSDWRTWFIGSLSALAAIVAWRRGLVQGLLVIVLGTGLGIGGLELRGERSWTPVILATVQGLIYVPAVAWVKSVIDRADRATATQLRAAQDAAVEASLARALEEQITLRWQALDRDVIPLLTVIATGTELDEAQRDTCRSVEGSTRDQLVASSLLSPAVVAAIAGARARGCRVQIAGRAPSTPWLAAFQAAALAVLDVARPRDRVTLRASTDEGGTRGTVVLVGTDAGALPLPELPPGCTIADAEGDPDSIVVEIGIL